MKAWQVRAGGDEREPEMHIVTSILGILRPWIQKLGPYLILEIVLPGGTVVALLLFLYRRIDRAISSLGGAWYARHVPRCNEIKLREVEQARSRSSTNRQHVLPAQRGPLKVQGAFRHEAP